MEEVKITKENALKAYGVADEAGKSMLTILLGAEIFQKEKKFKGQPKTFEDCCEATGTDYKLFLESCKNDSADEAAYKKLKIIAKALNEGWVPDWTNGSEYKYYPWFEYKSGVGFSYGDFDYWRTATDVGSRLCFKTSDLAKYAGTQFRDIYNEFLTLNK